MSMKSVDEIREDLFRTGIARIYYNAVRRMLLNQFTDGTLPQKEPKVEVGKSISDKKAKDLWNYYLFNQMLDDRRLIDAYLLGEPIVPRWGKKQVGNKEYRIVKFYPEGKTKRVVVFKNE